MSRGSMTRENINQKRTLARRNGASIITIVKAAASERATADGIQSFDDPESKIV